MARQPRVVDPRTGHGRVARQAYGAESARDVARDLDAELVTRRAPTSLAPRVRGQTDGEILRSLLAALERHGLIVDETTGPDVEGL